MITKNVKSKVNEHNQFQTSGHSAPVDKTSATPQSKTSAAKGDYIDFEDVK